MALRLTSRTVRKLVLAGTLVLASALIGGMLLGPAALGLSSGCGSGSGGYGGYGGSGGYGGYGGYIPPPGPCDDVSQTVGPGGTVSTGSTATASDPFTTSVTSPTGGLITIHEGVRTTGPPTGYSFFGQEIDITAPAATAENPLRITFQIDGSVVPAGTTAQNIVVFRDGTPVANCSDSSGAAHPDPCISNRSSLSGGDIGLTILTSHASRWNFGSALSSGDGGNGGGGGTETTPTPTSTGTTTTTTPVATPAVRDTTAPAVKLAVPKGQKLRAALKKGLKLSVSCSEACSIQGSAQIAKALAKKLKLGKRAVIVARGNGRLAQAGKTVVVLRFGAAAKRKLAKQRSVALGLKALVADSAGNSTTARSSLKLKR